MAESKNSAKKSAFSNSSDHFLDWSIWILYGFEVSVESLLFNKFYPLFSKIFAESALFLKWGYSGLGVKMHKL